MCISLPGIQICEKESAVWFRMSCNFKMDPYESGLFLFCGKKCDRLKALLWEPDGFVLLYKVLDNGRYQWPRNEKEVKERTWEQFTSKYCNSSVIGQAPKIGSPNDSNAVLH